MDNEASGFADVDRDGLSGKMPPAHLCTRQSFLGRCIEDPAHFLATAWNSAPYVSRGTSDCLSELLNVNELNRLLSKECIPHQYIRLVRDGAFASDREWTKAEPRTMERIPEGSRIGELVRRGYTLSIMQIDRFAPDLSALCDGLRCELSRHVTATAYFTPKSFQGFSTHYDDHDVIVLQLAGEKTWKIFDRVAERPQSNKGVSLPASTSPILATTMHSGDALYVPRGFVHCASADTEFSLHVSIGIFAVTVADVVRYALSQVAESPAMATDLPVGFAQRAGVLPGLISAGGELLAAKLAQPEWLEAISSSFCKAWDDRLASFPPITTGSN
jgi:bifunctional lysine-specific demethylase and histidyl-hydroxylase NO66